MGSHSRSSYGRVLRSARPPFGAGSFFAMSIVLCVYSAPHPTHTRSSPPSSCNNQDCLQTLRCSLGRVGGRMVATVPEGNSQGRGRWSDLHCEAGISLLGVRNAFSRARGVLVEMRYSVGYTCCSGFF